MLPISLFKALELRSSPEGEVFKTITSSGTGQRVSRIFWTVPPPPASSRPLPDHVRLPGERRLPFLVGQQAGSAQPRHVLARGRAFWAFLSSAPGPAMPWTSTWSWI